MIFPGTWHNFSVQKFAGCGPEFICSLTSKQQLPKNTVNYKYAKPQILLWLHVPALSPASMRNPTDVSRTCDNTRFPCLQYSSETGSWASIFEFCGLCVIKQIWIKSQQWLSPPEHSVGTTLMCSNQGDLTDFYSPEQTLNNFKERAVFKFFFALQRSVCKMSGVKMLLSWLRVFVL